MYKRLYVNIMPSGRRDLNSYRFWYPWRSWKQSFIGDAQIRMARHTQDADEPAMFVKSQGRFKVAASPVSSPVAVAASCVLALAMEALRTVLLR